MTAISMSSNSVFQSSAVPLAEHHMPVEPSPRPDSIGVPPVPATRKRGKCMSRRKGQNPKVRVGERADGKKYYFFQYWIDVPGQEERKRQTEVIGLVELLTRSERSGKS
jgi:hypothetical protein